MKRMKRKLASLLLALALVLCLVPLTALAEDLSGNISGAKEVSSNMTISGTCTIESSGTLTVKNGKTLTIATGGKLTIASGSGRRLMVEQGAVLDIYGTLVSSTQDFSDMQQYGTMKIHSGAAVKLADGAVTYIGEGGVVTLGENTTVTSTPNTPNTYNDGYTYQLDGTAETHKITIGQGQEKSFTVDNADAFVVTKGSTLKVPSGTMQLNGTNPTPLTIEAGGILDANTDDITTLLNGKEQFTGGTFTSNLPEGSVAEGYLVRKEGETRYTVVKAENLTAGVYTSDPTEFLAEGCTVSNYDKEAGLWTVTGPARSRGSSGTTNYYVIRTNREGSGTVEPGEKIMVRAGEDATLTFTPAADWTVGDVVVNHKSVGAVSEYTAKNIDGNINIEVTFIKDGTAVVTGNAENPSTGAAL